MMIRTRKTAEETMQLRIARCKELGSRDKPELLAMIHRLARVNGCDARTSKRDLINYLVDLELPMPRR